jgi:hypothetical protein
MLGTVMGRQNTSAREKNAAGVGVATKLTLRLCEIKNKLRLPFENVQYYVQQFLSKTQKEENSFSDFQILDNFPS